MEDPHVFVIGNEEKERFIKNLKEYFDCIRNHMNTLENKLNATKDELDYLKYSFAASNIVKCFGEYVDEVRNLIVNSVPHDYKEKNTIN